MRTDWRDLERHARDRVQVQLEPVGAALELGILLHPRAVSWYPGTSRPAWENLEACGSANAGRERATLATTGFALAPFSESGSISSVVLVLRGCKCRAHHPQSPGLLPSARLQVTGRFDRQRAFSSPQASQSSKS
jgi:hypothetical protein